MDSAFHRTPGPASQCQGSALGWRLGWRETAQSTDPGAAGLPRGGGAAWEQSLESPPSGLPRPRPDGSVREPPWGCRDLPERGAIPRRGAVRGRRPGTEAARPGPSQVGTRPAVPGWGRALELGGAGPAAFIRRNELCAVPGVGEDEPVIIFKFAIIDLGKSYCDKNELIIKFISEINSAAIKAAGCRSWAAGRSPRQTGPCSAGGRAGAWRPISLQGRSCLGVEGQNLGWDPRPGSQGRMLNHFLSPAPLPWLLWVGGGAE